MIYIQFQPAFIPNQFNNPYQTCIIRQVPTGWLGAVKFPAQPFQQICYPTKNLKAWINYSKPPVIVVN